MKGFSVIHHLLSRPREVVSALELGGLLDGASSISAGSPTAIDFGDAGPMLDAESKKQYRLRLEELEADLDAARRFNDIGRVEQLSDEMEFLEAEMRRAVGLSQRDRKASSTSERARIRITNAIRAAVSRIETHHPTLGAHLKLSIKTGAVCSYRPDPAVEIKWKLAYSSES